MNRDDLFRQLAELRGGSSVIAYLTSDRSPPFQAKMALDVIRPFYDHLLRIGRVRQIDLVIYSSGGDTIVPWRLANLLREFCKRFCVLIPFKAHSAATLLSLGADEIVMCPMGELSPIDPTISTPFNPPHPDNPNEKKLDIGVEDVFGYLNLAKERVGITDQGNLVQVFGRLTERLHPLAIGAVYRSHALIRLLAAKLLAMHMGDREASSRIHDIVDGLAEKLYYHSYLINREEARALGLKVKSPGSEVETALWEIFKSYEQEMELGKPFDPNAYKSGEQRLTTVATIDSPGLSSKFSKGITVTSMPEPRQPGGLPQFAVKEQAFGWITVETKENEK